MSIKVSVIIPVYNAEKYLRERMASLLNQTLKDIEIICVDDGSTDNSYLILEEYKNLDKRVVVLQQNNMYAGVARNVGLEVAQGEYVAFFDADDFCELCLLEKAYNKGIATDADIVLYGGAKYDTAKNKVISAPHLFKYDVVKDYETFNKNDIPDEICTVTSPAPWTKLYKRSFVVEKKLKYQPLQNSNDAFFTICALCEADRISYVNEILTYYRIDSVDSLQKTKRNNSLNFFAAYEAIYEELNRLNIYNVVSKSYINLALGGIVYNLESCGDSLSVYNIVKYFANEFNEKIKLLEFPLSFYKNKSHYFTVKNMLKIADFIRKKDELKSLEESRCVIGNSVIDPLVSVIVPVYNASEYLDECLNSIENQSLKNIEVICVNDGSQDNSLDILLEHARADARITVISQNNKGQSVARNVGVTTSKGKYIYFIDSDDVLQLEALNELVNKAECENLDVIYFNADSFGDNTIGQFEIYSNYYKRKNVYQGVYLGEDLFSEMLKNNEYRVSPCLQLIKKEHFDNNNLYFKEGIIHEDNLFNFKCMLSAKRVAHINRIFYQRRVHKNSVMTKPKTFNNVFGYFKCYQGMRDFYNSNKFNPPNIKMIIEVVGRVINAAKNDYEKLEKDDMLTYLGMDDQEQLDFKNIILDAHRNKLNLKSDVWGDGGVKFDNLSVQYEALLKDNEAKKKEIANIKNGWSFKIGRMITYLPRKIMGIKW